MVEQFQIRQTAQYRRWRAGFRDDKIVLILDRRIERLRLGLFGDAKALGGGVNELRVHVGPGHRIYFTQRESQVIILLCGGDKSSQTRDIALARKLAEMEP